MMQRSAQWPGKSGAVRGERRASSLTRLATDMAATRRGCVQPIMPYVAYPSSARYCVSCVVLPLPVSPTTTITLFSRITSIRSSRTPYTGRKRRCSSMLFVLANSDTAADLPSMCFANPSL